LKVIVSPLPADQRAFLDQPADAEDLGRRRRVGGHVRGRAEEVDPVAHGIADEARRQRQSHEGQQDHLDSSFLFQSTHRRFTSLRGGPFPESPRVMPSGFASG
jgi:hypothetical protein